MTDSHATSPKPLATRVPPLRLGRNPIVLIILALILSLLGGLGSALVKSQGGAVDVQQISWETPSGQTQSGQLFVPSTAADDAQAPAIVLAHGGSLNSEYTDQLFVELSRRGYVVYAIDMYGHGHSSIAEPTTMYSGLYEGVQYVSDLPYVNPERIGITGNSNGSFAVTTAILMDSAAPEPLITSVLHVVNDPMFTEDQQLGGFIDGTDTGFVNAYESRDVGLITAEYDLTFNRVVSEDGSVSAPRDFVAEDVVQSFLHFGEDPADLEERSSHETYRQTIEGREAIRAVYDEPMIHPWSVFDPNVASDTVEFFEASLPAPTPVTAGDQIWWLKPVFGAVGLFGLFLFVVSLARVLVATRFFRAVGVSGPAPQSRIVDRQDKTSFWVGSTLIGVVTALAFVPIFWITSALKPALFGQAGTYSLAVWALFSGIVTLLVTALSHRKLARRKKLPFRQEGAILTARAAGSTVLLAILVSAATYGVVFLIGWLFGADLHVWLVLGLNTFPVHILLEAAKYLPFFLIYFVALSVATNVFNYVRIFRAEWLNLALMAVLNTLGPLLLLGVVYGIFVVTGNTPFEEIGVPLFTPLNAVVNVIVILPVATIVTRLIYNTTRNPYLGGIIMAVLATLLTCGRALTMV